MVLVVWQQQATVAPPPLRQLPGLDHPDQRPMESVGKACEWKHPRAPTAELLFQDGRATWWS